MRTFELTREFAQEKDRQDILAKFQDRFYKIKDTIYMDGNSLGLCSKDAEARIIEAIEDWKRDGIGVWEKDGYFLYQDTLGALCAPLVNADPDEVTIMNSTTNNVHQGIATFYHPTADRYKILVDDVNFPTDRYAIDSQVRIHGYDPAEAVKVVKSRDGQYIYEDDIIEAMTDDVCIVFLPSALYRSAQVIDMKKIADAAHDRGIYVGFDLCHSIGAVPHDFKAIQPDFAVWCDYKYLNGGPGAIAGFYINRKHFGMEPGLAGWHGNRKDTQFDLKQEFEHAYNAGGFQTGTQPVFCMAGLEASLKMFAEAGLENIRAKSLDITDYMMYLIDNKLAQYGFRVGNPREDERRTGHVALVHDDAIRINAAMKANGVLPDFRFPDVIRLAPVALYTSYEEVYDMVEIIEEIMVNKKYEGFSGERGTVA
ncbi:MAG: kynureninase [Mogibacterium sp.]|nr:kynureninase [Mogibacterium sp.]